MTPIAGTANAAALKSPLESQRNFRRRSMNVRTGPPLRSREPVPRWAARAISRDGAEMRWRDSRQGPLRERPVPPCPLRAATPGRGHVSAAPVIAVESHGVTRIGCSSVHGHLAWLSKSGATINRGCRENKKGGSLRPPSWGGGNRDGRALAHLSGGIPSLLTC